MRKQPPIAFRVYSFLRRKISVAPTYKPIIIYSLLLGVISGSGVLYVYGPMLGLVATAVVPNSVFFYLLTVSKSDWNREIHMTNISNKTLLSIYLNLIISTVILYLIGRPSQINEILTIFLPLIIGSVYWTKLYNYGARFKERPSHYVMDISEYKDTWVKAGTLLELAIEQLKEEHLYRAYYNLQLSKIKYKFLADNEERDTEKDMAGFYIKMAEEVEQSIFADPGEIDRHLNRFNKLQSRAAERVKWRTCDTCREKTKRKDSQFILNDDGTIHGVYCNSCYYGKKTNEDENAPNRLSEEEALNILGLSENPTNSEVKSAYREKAKETHPDRGGDKDKFKRVNRAKNHLLGP